MLEIFGIPVLQTFFLSYTGALIHLKYLPENYFKLPYLFIYLEGFVKVKVTKYLGSLCCSQKAMRNGGGLVFGSDTLSLNIRFIS